MSEIKSKGLSEKDKAHDHARETFGQYIMYTFMQVLEDDSDELGPAAHASARSATLQFRSQTGLISELTVTGSGLKYDSNNHIAGGVITSLDLLTDGSHHNVYSGFGKLDAAAFQNAAIAGGQTFYYFLTDLMNGATKATGGAGSDGFDVGDGNDIINGGGGDDAVWKFRSGNVNYDGGAGLDWLNFQSYYGPYPTTPTQKLVVNLTTGEGTNPYGGKLTLKNVENIVGTANADTIYGSNSANIVGDGQYDIGADRVRTYGGNDTVRWGFGVEGAFADGGQGSDTLAFVLTSYDKSKSHRLDLTNASHNTGIFAYNTAKNFENLAQSDDLLPAGTRVDFIGNDLTNRVEIYSTGRINLAGGQDWYYQHDQQDQTVDGGSGTDRLVIEDLAFNAGNVLDLSNQKANTDSFAGSIYRNFEIFDARDHITAWTFRGANGAQTFLGGDGNETALGRGGDDVLRGYLGNDVLDGGAGRDTLQGGAWADILKGGAGNDIIDGGKETPASWRDDDIAVYSGRASNYDIGFSKGVVTIRDLRSGSPDGTDKVTNVESFEFSDKALSLADLIGRGPSIKGGPAQTFTVKEGALTVADLQTTDTFGDKEGSGLTYTIIPSIYAHGTEDGFDFNLDAKTGKLTFKVKPDFEHPADEGHNNIYNIIVRVTDSHGISDSQNITIKVQDVAGRAVTDFDLESAFADTAGTHHDILI